MRAINEQCVILVAHKLVNGITADIASIQVTVDLQLPIQIQLPVYELQEPVKTACAHIAPFGPIALMSVTQHLFYRQDHLSVCSLLLMHQLKIAHIDKFRTPDMLR